MSDDGEETEKTKVEAPHQIVLSDSARRAIGLQSIIIRPEAIHASTSTVGKVEAIPTREFVQHASLSGRITNVLVKLGDRVSANQQLAILNSPELNILAAETLQARAQIAAEIKRSRAELDSEVSQAEAQVELTQANYSRDKQLVAEKIGSQKAMQTSLAENKVAQSRLQMAKAKKRPS